MAIRKKCASVETPSSRCAAGALPSFAGRSCKGSAACIGTTAPLMRPMATGAGIWLDELATVTGACPHSHEFNHGGLVWAQIWYVPGARGGRRNEPPAPIVAVADVFPADLAGTATPVALTRPVVIAVPSLPVTVLVISPI